MAVQFDGIPFRVYVIGDAQLPEPTRDENGYKWYEATIRIASRTDYNDLDELLTGIDIIPAMGMKGGGIVQRRWGAGSKSLTYPRDQGDEHTRTAILVELSPIAELLREEFQATARWVFTGIG